MNSKYEKRNFRKVILAIADMFIISTSCLLTNFVLSFFNLSPMYAKVLTLQTFVLIILNFLALWVCGAYSKLWRYFNARDYLSCLGGTAIATAIFLLFNLLGIFGFLEALTINQSFYLFVIINFVISTLGIMLFRLIFKKTFLIIAEAGRDDMRKRTLIVGGGLAGNMILTEIENAKYDNNNPSNEYEPIGIIDDAREKVGTYIKDVKVLGTTDRIAEICEEEDIEVIIFAIPSCDEENRRRILDICSRTKCIIKVVPYLSQLLFDDSNPKIMNQISDIKIEDLLGRPAISFDGEEIKNLIKNKICLVTGGGGSIGSELVRQIVKYSPKQVIIVDIYENNAYDIQQELIMDYGSDINLVTLIASVRDYDKMQKIFEKYSPDLVFHAAAHKHVPLMEDAPEEAVKNNVVGTFNVATLSAFYNVKKFIMISTDKAVNPTNVMGATKRCCEMIIQYMAQSGTKTEFVTTRFGNVLGSNGSVIPLFKRQIENGKAITVTHPDIIRYFMTIPEAVSLVLEAGAMAQGGEIFVLDMGAPVKITTLAENLIRMYGKVPYKDVEIKFTGLRPGEKLFEELLMNEEGLKSTSNKKIFIGNHINIDMQAFLEQLDNLKTAAEANDSQGTIDMLREIVPTFNHKKN